MTGARSDAQEAAKGKGAVESSNRRGNEERPSNLTQGSHQPVTAINEDASRETSIAAVPYLSSGGGSSAYVPLPETDLPNQSLPALTNMPRPLNAGEGEPNRLADATTTSLKRKLPELISDPQAKWRGREEAYRSAVARAESQPGTSRFANTTMRALKRKMTALISSRVADMNKLKSKWRRIEEEYWRVAWAIEEGISFPSEKVAEVEELSKEIEDIFLVLGRFWPEGKALASRTKTSPSVTVELLGKETRPLELLGKETRRKVNEIFSYLMQDNVSIIGVYGMGGVGKTAILRHVYNRLHDLGLVVFWVAVPQDFSVYALQEEIASVVGLNLSNEKDVKRRAGLLYAHLNVRNGPILILDGLWMHFEVKDVGILVETGNVKLVVTTRALDVCRMVHCQKKIKIKLLDMEDSWDCHVGQSRKRPIWQIRLRRWKKG